MTFDPAKVSYDKLLDVFWVNHRPDGARPPVLRRRLAIPAGNFLLLGRAEAPGRSLQGEMGESEALPPADPHADYQGRHFWPAEYYHQDYYKKNALQYRFYVTGCGRYARLDSLWGSLRAK